MIAYIVQKKKAFPPFRSYNPEELTEQIKYQVEHSEVKDVMLIADSLGEYGKDLEGDKNLPWLIKKIISIDPQIRVALNNYNPQFIIEHINEIEFLIKKGRICHINMPIQSACDRVLKAMHRHYTKKQIRDIIEVFRRNQFDVFDTHIIIGFDGETEEDFKETVDFVCDNSIRYVLASQYYNMGNVNEKSVSQEEKDKRTDYCYQKYNEKGIIINCERSKLQSDRLKTICGEA